MMLESRVMAAAFVAFVCAIAAGGWAHAQNFGGAFDGMANSSEPIQIEANSLEVEDGKGTAVFSGKVEVVQGSTILNTSRLFVEYARDSSGRAGPGGNVNRIEASGGVAVRSRDQHATAQRAEVDMRTQIAKLTGDVAVSQGNNVIRGCVVTLNMKTNNIDVKPCGGRVRVLIDQTAGDGQ
jgi:lipopolysaccharide export system protein LptA